MTLVDQSQFAPLSRGTAPSPMTRSSEIPMGQRSGKNRQLSDSHRQLSNAGSRVSAYLRRLYPSRTADQVAADTGIKAATISKWLERESVPNGVAMLLLLAVYGPDFMGAVLPRAPGWLNDERRSAEVSGVIAELDAIKARLLATETGAG